MHRFESSTRRTIHGPGVARYLLVIAALVAVVLALVPTLRSSAEKSRLSRAGVDAQNLAHALAAVREDTGQWPFTMAGHPSEGRPVDRLVSSPAVPTRAGAAAGAGAANWGSFGASMQLGSVLRPDDRLQRTQEGRWLGPYTDSVETTDPWGNAYVVNVRYLPGGGYSGKTPHRVLVLSAGPDGVWQTSYRDDTTEAILGDDIGYEVPMPRESGVLIPR